jgi:hemerythrin-like domain-containing protein
MSSGPTLLNSDGSASMATAVLMSHHGLRRDIHRFELALENIAKGDSTRIDAVREEWRHYRDTLHGHHEAEDFRLFPHLRTQHEPLGPILDRLSADHRRIDPLLARGDDAFAALPSAAPAAQVVRELRELLDSHLELEEAEVIPFLRDAKDFPAPADDAEAVLYAQGFAWSSQGVAAEVLERVYAMLPKSLTSRLPAAGAAFDARCERAWGSAAAGTSCTAIPER